MTLKRESILAAITTPLAGTVGVGPRIYRSRTEAMGRNEAPLLIVETTDDQPRQDPVSMCWIDWTLGVDIIVHTRGQVPTVFSRLLRPVLATPLSLSQQWELGLPPWEVTTLRLATLWLHLLAFSP